MYIANVRVVKTIEKIIPIWYVDLTGIVWIRGDFMVVRWTCNDQSAETGSLWTNTSESLDVLSDSAESDVISSCGDETIVSWTGEDKIGVVSSVSDVWNTVSVGVFDVSAVSVVVVSDDEVWSVDNVKVVVSAAKSCLVVWWAWVDTMNFPTYKGYAKLVNKIKDS